MGQRDLVSVGSWVALGVTCWIIAWIIAEGIPSFSNLLSLIVSWSLFIAFFFLTNIFYRALYLPVGLAVSPIQCVIAYRGILTVAVGLGGVYWLHLNWGRYFSSPRKIALTIVNALIVCIGATIVRSPYFSRL